jgi:hypothetical protein
MRSVRIRGADPTEPLEPNLLDIVVSACWTSAGRRIGEDQNCNGVLDTPPTVPITEDTNGNGWLDSPAMASTRMAIR